MVIIELDTNTQDNTMNLKSSDAFILKYFQDNEIKVIVNDEEPMTFKFISKSEDTIKISTI